MHRSVLSRVQRALRSSSARQSPRGHRRALTLECLEDRLVLSTLMVNGSLDITPARKVLTPTRRASEGKASLARRVRELLSGRGNSTTADSLLTLREANLLVNNGGNANTALDRIQTAGEQGQITGTFGSQDTK